MASNYAGYWTGKFEGTNSGGFTVDIREDGDALTGTAKFNEPALGQYEYVVAGRNVDPLSLRLTPSRGQGGFNLGVIAVVGTVAEDGTLSGKWKSSIGTEGIFSVRRFDSRLQDAALPKQNSVFLVHGHDEGAQQGVARFLEQLGVVPVILQEQINRGMTLIEKFEEFAARAGFAVVLMTPDDFGYPAHNEGARKHRPRQNVVLELGYFAAKLGRSRTFVLVKGDIELPSDVLGLAYESMDRSEGWKVKLARELLAAGFKIDLNRAIAPPREA